MSGSKRGRAAWGWVLAGAGLFLAGCSRPAPPPETSKPDTRTKVQPERLIPGSNSPAPLPNGQHFSEAVLLEPPEGECRPPDMTAAGKKVWKLFEEISGPDGLWSRISLVDPQGKPLRHAAVLKTDLGDITLELFSEAAPNHVRNFIALARVGYYDGLAFDRAIRQKFQSEDKKEAELDLLEAGCPLVTGEPGHGSIGYWLKPEISSQLAHDEGTVGACHGEQLESAAAKFYITLGKAPWMNGNWTIFGKVSKGLDIARAIFQRPTTDGDPTRPREPVRIREVIIQTQE